jgi:hypothetical protein
MFGRFKKQKKKAFFWTEQAKRFDLSDKRFAEALILRACHSFDESEDVSPSIPEQETLFETLEFPK